jgi:hypothetical protein
VGQIKPPKWANSEYRNQAPYPICVDGKLQGPPEDCGGIPGYYNLLEAIRDPAHKEHEDMLDWVGGEFNPDVFSAEDVNRRLSPIQHWGAKT